MKSAEVNWKVLLQLSATILNSLNYHSAVNTVASTRYPTLRNSPEVFGGKNLELLSFLEELGICTSKINGHNSLYHYENFSKLLKI